MTISENVWRGETDVWLMIEGAPKISEVPLNSY